ncbi:MAG: TIGR02266 family protein [Halobacteriovoraceae bacterium]|nr:TIGR02266 family protein [Halobacteriovoraceae bacterium]
MSQFERRDSNSYLRIKLRLLITFNNGNVEDDYFIENISKGGMFIEADSIPSVGSKLTINFALPHNNKSYKVNSKVAWVREEKPNYPPGFGVQFLDLTEHDAEEIRDSLEQYADIFNLDT